MIRTCFVALSLAAAPASAIAQMDHSGHEMMTGTASEHAEAWAEINRRMHEAMMIESTGDPDVDFIRGMIPHHQGAVDMAEYVLEHGQDPEVRALAEEIIETQEEEISLMRQWLEERDVE